MPSVVLFNLGRLQVSLSWRGAALLRAVDMVTRDAAGALRGWGESPEVLAAGAYRGDQGEPRMHAVWFLEFGALGVCLAFRVIGADVTPRDVPMAPLRERPDQPCAHCGTMVRLAGATVLQVPPDASDPAAPPDAPVRWHAFHVFCHTGCCAQWIKALCAPAVCADGACRLDADDGPARFRDELLRELAGERSRVLLLRERVRRAAAEFEEIGALPWPPRDAAAAASTAELMRAVAGRGLAVLRSDDTAVQCAPAGGGADGGDKGHAN
jgi:hypothetical protein